jgi:uncharacterized membrane protein
MLTLLLVLITVGAGLIGGVFLAFSSFVMKALTEVTAEHGVAAMQRINVVVLNPLFLSLFVGTALLACVCIVGAVFSWGTPRSGLLLGSSLTYLIGSFGVTVAFNVPRNDRLAQLPSESREAAEYWPIYVREWLFWNHIRTAASAISAAAGAIALAH